jgi:hypothetical protein
MTFCNSLHRSDVDDTSGRNTASSTSDLYLHLAFENTLEKHLVSVPVPFVACQTSCQFHSLPPIKRLSCSQNCSSLSSSNIDIT